MIPLKKSLNAGLLLAAIPISLGVIIALTAGAQVPPNPEGKTGTTAVIAGDADAGAELFESVCAECHGPAATAPTLRGVIGRRIASVESFYGYSEALKAKNSQTWTEANLNAFLKSPTDFAPGTLMYKTVPDAKNRADLLAFIATLPPPRNN
jgi:cytochrome c